MMLGVAMTLKLGDSKKQLLEMNKEHGIHHEGSGGPHHFGRTLQFSGLILACQSQVSHPHFGYCYILVKIYLARKG